MTKAIAVGDFSDPSSIRYVEADFDGIEDHYWIRTTDGLLMISTGVDLRYEDRVRNIVAQRAALKQAFDESMSLIYELNNQVTRDKSK